MTGALKMGTALNPRNRMSGECPLTIDRSAALGLSRRTVAYYLSGEQPVPKTVMLAAEGYDGRRAG